MIILDIPRRTPRDCGYLDIPVYHRTHLGLSLLTKVNYCVLPTRPSPQTGDLIGSAPELILAPFVFETWDRLWRLTVSLHDKPGLLYEISDTLRQFGVSIVASESTMMQERDMYHVEMILDIPTDQKRQVVELMLLARLIDTVAFLSDGSPRFRMRRVHNLWRAKEAYDQQMSLSNLDTRDALSFWPCLANATVEPVPGTRKMPRALRLELSSEVRAILKKTVASTRDWGHHLRISDTKDRFMRVLYFRSSDPVLHVRLEHADHVGAFADITRSLRDGGFTLITALSTPSALGSRAISEFVVRALSTNAASDAATTKKRLERALASAPAAKQLRFKVGYPSGYSATWEKKSLRALKPAGTRRLPPEPPATSFAASLQARHGAWASALQAGTLSPEDRYRLDLSNRLTSHYEAIQRLRKPGALFISCHFAEDTMEIAVRAAAERGFTVVTGQNLLQSPDIMAGLIDKIRLCRDFLGIWTETGASRVGDQCWPSPWLLWELGVAAAFHVNWRLVISKAISAEAWRKLAPSRQHELYGEGGFERSVISTLEALLASPVERDAHELQTHYSEI